MRFQPARRRADALRRVRADVMVVAAGAEVRGLRAELCHQSEAEQVAVERDGVGDRCDLQMNVAHDRAGRDCVEWLGRRVKRSVDITADTT